MEASHQNTGGTAPLLRLRGVSKAYDRVIAVQPLDLDIYPRDFVAMLGPSGCGKTTLLRMIGGFIAPTTGTIEIAGVDVTPVDSAAAYRGIDGVWGGERGTRCVGACER